MRQLSIYRTNRLCHETGSALLVVLAILLLGSLVGIQMFSTTNDDLTISFNNQDATKAFYAAESGLAVAMSQLWTGYVNSASTNPQKLPGEVGTTESYKKYLDQLDLADGDSKVLTTYVPLGEGQTITNVTAERADIGGGVSITVSSTGESYDLASQTIRAVYQVEGEAFKGLDFAILAKNVNCIMCHARIDNVDRVHNADPSKVGTFDRVKVASLESLLLRTTSAESWIAGTLYTRGIVTDKQGNPISDLSPSGTGLNGFEINQTDGKILDPLNTVGLTNTGGSPLDQYGNLYLNYPTDEGDMTDGALPDEFPSPFPDANGNKMVDDQEFDDLASSFSGSVSGGILYGVPSGGSYSTPSLPGSGNVSSVSGRYNGNLILVGTDADPIVINKDVAVDGDVIIQGKVVGTGQIYARGNVYVTGDLTYADGDSAGSRTYGVSSGGTRNALSLAAGKNILVGDYLTPKKADILDPTALDPGNQDAGETFSFAQSEMTLFNRSEWAKTQPTLPGAGGSTVNNPGYIPGYTPRYYTMNDGDPVYIYNKSLYDAKKDKEKGTYFDPASNSWKGKEHAGSYDMNMLTKLDAGSPDLNGATMIPLSSTSSWITPETLKSLWIDDEMNRPAGSDFKIDGQLYTNNSIFTLTRKASNTGGHITVNGALVAADVGVLAGNGIDLNYDQRMRTFLKIKDASKVEMQRVAWYSN